MQSAETMGAIFSLACALTWAMAVVLLKHTVERVSPFSLNLFRVTFTTPLLIVTFLAAGQPWIPDTSRANLIRLTISSLVGIALADTLFHQSLKLVGVGIVAIIDTLYAPMVVVFLAFVFLGERIHWNDYAGLVLISSALLVTSRLQPPRDRTRVQLLEGIGIGLLAIVFLSFGIVVAKPALNRLPVLWAAAYRQVVAAVALLGLALASPRRRDLFSVLRPAATWKVMVPGAILGSYLALTLWIAGMKYTMASIAGILGQSSTLWILVFSVVFLREPFTRRTALAAALALAGVLLVTLI